MIKQRNGQAVSRRRHSVEFKVEALGLAERVGVASAAKQLGLHESQLYDWRKKARYEAGRSECGFQRSGPCIPFEEGHLIR